MSALLLFVLYGFCGIVSSLAVPEHLGKREQQCYGDLGCFTTEGHFAGFSLPDSPTSIQTKFQLYTRAHNHPVAINAGDQHSISNSHFQTGKPTKFIIHGYTQDGSTTWVIRIKDAILHKDDANVIIVDWGKGAGGEYDKAVSNVFVVAMETVKLLHALEQHHAHPYDKVHLIGHSLGAQVCGYVGSKLNKIGRITGMDPAGPNFDGKDSTVRLDPKDAHFVDIIHSDAAPFLIYKGFGTTEKCGHVDFFPNGGDSQRGCTEDPLGSALHNILHGGVSGAASALSCSHGRSHEFFLESISSHCQFHGHPCASYDDFKSGKCMGCGHGCAVMGYGASSSGPKGTFYLATTDKSPFCGHEYYMELKMAGSHMETTYGDVILTFIGSKGHSAEMTFLKDSGEFTKGAIYHQVIATSHDVGTISQVKIKFNKGSGLLALGTSDDFAVHSLTVRPLSGGSSLKFCGHDALVHGEATLNSHSGC